MKHNGIIAIVFVVGCATGGVAAQLVVPPVRAGTAPTRWEYQCALVEGSESTGPHWIETCGEVAKLQITRRTPASGSRLDRGPLSRREAQGSTRRFGCFRAMRCLRWIKELAANGTRHWSRHPHWSRRQIL